jgi:hypothetical protein
LIGSGCSDRTLKKADHCNLWRWLPVFRIELPTTVGHSVSPIWFGGVGQGISPAAWRNVHLIGNFDFTTASSEVDIEAIAARYQNEDFWRRSMSEVEDEGPQ